MGRRKGETTNKMRNRTHPFQVEIVVPETGLGNAMLIMFRWASRHDHETMSGKGPGQTMRWCFCRREVADAFAADFGGLRVDLACDPRYLKRDEPDAHELERRARAALFGLEGMTKDG